MALSDLTAAAVRSALAEFDALGRDDFLAKYGFGEARKFFLVQDDRRYDSKAVAGAAHGYLPGASALAATEFSGGEDHAVDVLRSLGFAVIEQDGDAGLDRQVALIDDLRPSSAGGRPMLKQAVVLAWAISQAHQGRARFHLWETTKRELEPLLRRFRRDGESSQPNVAHPVAALYRKQLWDLQQFDGTVPTAQGHPESWFDAQQPLGGLPADLYDLVRASATARLELFAALRARFDLDAQEIDDLMAAVGVGKEEIGAGPVTDEDAYSRLCRLAERHELPGVRRPNQRNDPIRSAAARRAVLLRSQGCCEYCGQVAPDVTDRGDPVLEIDHIQQIAEDGRDHPEQMIALCPNCHAVKTHGRSRHTLSEQLRRRATELHQKMASS